jgi:hypothetical protein
MQNRAPDWPVLHTAEEMQQLSNLGHTVEGILLLLVAMLALAEAAGLFKTKIIWSSFTACGWYLSGRLFISSSRV